MSGEGASGRLEPRDIGELRVIEDSDPPLPPQLRPRRRGWIIAGIVVAAILVLGVIGWFVAESALRAESTQRVVTLAADFAPGADPDEIDVEISATPMLIQLIGGRLESVNITVPGFELLGAETVAELQLTDVPISDGEIGRVAASVAIPVAELTGFVADQTGLPITSLTAAAPEVVAAGELALAFFSADIEVGVTPTVSAGELVLTPSTVAINGASMAVSEVRDLPLVGGVLSSALAPQTVCVVDQLPQGVRLTGAKVVGGDLVVALMGTQVGTAAVVDPDACT